MNKSDIERVTRDYWESFDPSQLDEAIQFYICKSHARLGGRSLLEAELEYAKSEGRIKAKPCNTLVLLVGFSLEPLLQSVCVYKPQKVVLLLNEAGYPPESWQVFAHHVVEAIDRLVEKGMLSQRPEAQGAKGYPTADSPEAVFQTLVEVLHDEEDVVIDITGGKKSMVSGAYFYAAYAEARISYVDFDEYDPKSRRPYGYSCKIGELDNPYKTFALREWERVRALYKRYQFREALDVLKNFLLPAMKQVMPETEQHIQQLAAFLEYYERWDRGDYRGARQVVQNLPSFAQPSAVTELGDRWFKIRGSRFIHKPSHFYGNLDAVKVYVTDELARIRRLIDYNEDYRSAFLRAGGVNEIVMLARLARLVPDGQDKDSLLGALDQRTPPVSSIFKALVTSRNIKIGADKKNDISLKGAPTISVPNPVPMKSWWQKTKFFKAQDGWDIFLTLRNELAHKYFSVPRELAEDARCFVRANFEDFLGHPVEHLGLCTEALPWPKLCEMCGLSCFLPPNLRKEAE